MAALVDSDEGYFEDFSDDEYDGEDTALSSKLTTLEHPTPSGPTPEDEGVGGLNLSMIEQRYPILLSLLLRPLKRDK